MRLLFKTYCVRIIAFLGLTIFTFSIKAQIPVGSWRDHLPYSHCKKVMQIKDKFFCATDLNIFTYSTTDNSFEKLSKISGLSDMGIACMDYSYAKEILVIAYNNGNIDLINNNNIFNIADLKSKNITGSKQANQIYFLDDFAYICYSFGIMVVDLVKKEIKDTYIIGIPGENYEVNALTSNGTYFYAATRKGIFKALVNDPYLVNFNRWQHMDDIEGSYDAFDHICSFQDKIIVGKVAPSGGDPLFIYSGGIWNPFPLTLQSAVKEIRIFEDHIVLTAQGHVYVLNNNFQIQHEFIYSNPNSTVFNDNTLWIADNEYGLIKKTITSGDPVMIFPNGPWESDVNNMTYQNGAIVATGGGVDQSWGNLYRKGKLFSFKDEVWTNTRNEDAFDYILSTADPVDQSVVYAGSWGNGIYVYQNNTIITNYSINNSSLQSTVAGDQIVRIGGIVFDSENNMWVANSGVSSPISVRKADGSWKSFAYGSYLNVNTIGAIHIDRSNQIWTVLPRMQGLFVFDTNGTIDNADDDRYLKFKPLDYYNESISNIFCVTSDRDGTVWVGTDKGPVMYSNPEDVLDGQTTGSQITIKRQDAATGYDILLGTETINCITIDGANRKWFGTEKGGAFLFSADGQTQIYHFNTDNSPIFSNTIRTIAVHDKTGEVFFGTDLGIISFRTIATAPNEDFSEAYVFPNPVRPEYSGDIIVSGLVYNTSVKITDISGNLVYETKSQGGQAIWDGKIRSGRRAATGVYLIFLTNEDGSATRVIKLLMVK
jgi:hypothetical protein